MTIKASIRKFIVTVLAGVTVMTGLVVAPMTAQAACSAEVDIVTRDPNGDLTPGLKFEIYGQQSDANGDLVPSQYRKASGTIAFNGKGYAKFVADSDSGYAVKVYEKNSTVGAYWFFDAFDTACGGHKEVELQLSTAGLTIRDIQNKLVDSATVYVYKQAVDADGKPTVTSKNLIGSYTYANGIELRMFLPDAAHTLDGNGTYIFSIRPSYGKEFIKDNVVINDGDATAVEYTLSGIEFDVRDANANPYPKDTAIYIYEQPDPDREIVGSNVGTVKTDEQGIAVFTYPAGTYMARVKTSEGSFDFYNQEIISGEKISSQLKTNIDLRNSTQTCTSTTQIYVVTKRVTGRLIPFMQYELFEQGSYSDGNTVINETIASGTTDATGRALIKAKISNLKTYTLRAYQDSKEVGAVWIPNLQFTCGERRDIEAKVPALNLTIADASGTGLGNTPFKVYRQILEDGRAIKDTAVSGSYTTDASGRATVLLPYGSYIIEIKNAAGTTYDVTHIEVPFDRDKDLTIKLSEIVFQVVDTNGKAVSVGVSIDVHNQIQVGEQYVLGATVVSSAVDHNGNAIMQLPAGIYAASVRDGQGRIYNFFNVVAYDDQRAVQKLVLDRTQSQALPSKPSFTPLFTSGTTTNKTAGLLNRLHGNILLQVEGHGEAFYVDKDSQGRYYLQDGNAAYTIMRKFGLGITNADLEKIPVGYDSRFSIDKDSDGDGLSDKLEEAIGTNPVSSDSDHDFYPDREELQNGYSPFGTGKTTVDQNLANRLKGKILIQVESKGQAWYVNPKDGKRYYMADGESAFEIMRYLGLGITNADLENIPVKSL